MWFPIDQPAYYDDPAHAEEIAFVRAAARAVEVEGRRRPAVVRRRLRRGVRRAARRTSATTCSTSPTTQRQWRWDQQHGMWGYIDPDRQEVVAAPPRLLREAAADGRRVARHRARRARGERRVRRHDRHLHVGPRRHVRLARTAQQGPVRLRGDHARAVLRQGARHHDGRARSRARSARTSTSRRRSARSAASIRRRSRR